MQLKAGGHLRGLIGQNIGGREVLGFASAPIAMDE